jgi:hypothetical protein
MKRFWLVLLSLGLVMAFSVSAFAVDVKVGAEYYVGGLYLNKTSLNDGGLYNSAFPVAVVLTPYTVVNPSTAFFYQRLRVGTDFIVSPCLKLVTQFDAMERIWGGARSNTWQANQQPYDPYAAMDESAGTRAETENIAFRLGYIDYTSPIGKFQIGYQEDYVWGTVWGDRGNGTPAGQIAFITQAGPVTVLLDYAKEVDNSYSAVSSTSWYWLNRLNASRTDRDEDSYRIGGIYSFKGGEVGGLFLWNRNATDRGYASGPFLQNVYLVDPYVKAKVGPVALQAEVLYFFGDAEKWENNYSTNNVSIGSLSAFLDATANFGMFYAGGSVAYVQGQNPSDTNKLEGGVAPLSGGLDWNPCLIMFNTETLGYWVGGIYGHDGSVIDNEMMNAWFGQLRAGVKPTPQWDIMASVSYAQADQNGIAYAPNGSAIGTIPGKTYGTEIDVTGTYKITNNLSYMMGGGYLFTGDYFKGLNSYSGSKVTDDFMFINKLTLNF